MKKTPDTILITGAGGALGSELVRGLVNCKDKSFKIIALDLTKEKMPEDFLTNNSIDCYDNEDWRQNRLPWKKIDTIVHCAFARSSEGRLLADSLYFTKKLLQKTVSNKVKSIINISSQSVYGRSQPPLWTEKTPVSPEPPDTFYALAKYSSELLTTSICKGTSTNFTNLRLASLSGKGMDERLTSKFVRQALAGKPIKLIGGDQIMAYMDIRDAVEGIIALIITKPYLWKDVYNFGSQWRYTIKEIAEAVARIAKEYTSKNVIMEIEEKKVILDTGMDSKQFYKDTNWLPKYDIELMIKGILNNYLRD